MTVRDSFAWHDDDPDEYADWDSAEAAWWHRDHPDWLDVDAIMAERARQARTISPSWDFLNAYDEYRLGQPVKTLPVSDNFL